LKLVGTVQSTTKSVWSSLVYSTLSLMKSSVLIFPLQNCCLLLRSSS
jgi:hypothetical protein